MSVPLFCWSLTRPYVHYLAPPLPSLSLSLPRARRQSELRRVLERNYPPSHLNYCALGALLFQATYGDHNPDIHRPGFLTPELLCRSVGLKWSLSSCRGPTISSSPTFHSEDSRAEASFLVAKRFPPASPSLCPSLPSPPLPPPLPHPRPPQELSPRFSRRTPRRLCLDDGRFHPCRQRGRRPRRRVGRTVRGRSNSGVHPAPVGLRE